MLGVVLGAQGELGEARARLEASLEMMYALYDPQGEGRAHPLIAGTLQVLGVVLRAQGEQDEAMARVEASLKMQYTLHDPHKRDTDTSVTL